MAGSPAGARVFNGCRDAGKRMYRVQEGEPRVLPRRGTALPACVPRGPTGQGLALGLISAGAGGGRAQGPLGHAVTRALMLVLQRGWRHHYQTPTVKARVGLGGEGRGDLEHCGPERGCEAVAERCWVYAHRKSLLL